MGEPSLAQHHQTDGLTSLLGHATTRVGVAGGAVYLLSCVEFVASARICEEDVNGPVPEVPTV